MTSNATFPTPSVKAPESANSDDEYCETPFKVITRLEPEKGYEQFQSGFSKVGCYYAISPGEKWAELEENTQIER
jgi:hypothetical protein